MAQKKIMPRIRIVMIWLLISLLVSSCGSASQAAADPAQPEEVAPATDIVSQTATPLVMSPTVTETQVDILTQTATATASSTAVFPTPKPATATPTIVPATATPDTRLLPRDWRSWPTVPVVSGKVREIFQQGQEMGYDPHMFTRVGDCQSIPEVFLGIYGTDRYFFNQNSMYLQQTVDWFAPAFALESMAAKDGFGVASVLAPLMADPVSCEPDETPLACEFRLHKPAFAFIAMGTNWAPNANLSFEKYLYQIVDYSIEQGVVPILVTKADNIEQDYALNESIARVAYDRDVPLFNAWNTFQYLPNHGLEEDNIYLTPAAWDERNFGALQTLDAIVRFLMLIEPAP